MSANDLVLMRSLLDATDDEHLHQRSGDHPEEAERGIHPDACLECERPWPCYVERARQRLAATECPECGGLDPHYHRETLDGPEIVRIPERDEVDSFTNRVGDWREMSIIGHGLHARYEDARVLLDEADIGETT